MHASIGTVHTLAYPPSPTTPITPTPIKKDFANTLENAMQIVDSSWTKQRVQRLERWCLSKASTCQEASMCAEALAKHIDATHPLIPTDFLKIAFIVNQGLLLLDEEVESTSECVVLPPASISSELTTSHSMPIIEEELSVGLSMPITDTEEMSLAEIEQQMHDLLGEDE
jgi:hypothetical protein